MELNRALQTLEDQPWLEPLEGGLEKIAATTLSGGDPVRQRIKDTLHGTWLGHPLHPVLTDVSLGSWTATLLLDTLETTTGRRAFGSGADVALGLGLMTAVPTAISGITDWQHTSGRPRKLGVAHAFFNVVATVCYLLSLLLRRAGARGAGRVVALLGFGAVMLGAYIGGDLVYGHKIGTDHSPDTDGIDDFVAVLADAELSEGERRRVTVEQTPIMLVKLNGRVFALANTCSHLAGPLDEGTIEDCSVICPWHGSRFSLADGRVINGPATFPQPAFETRVREGQIEIRPLT